MSDKRGSSGRHHDHYGPFPCAEARYAWPSFSDPLSPQAPCSRRERQQHYEIEFLFSAMRTYPRYDLLYPFLMAFHLQEGLNLGQGEILPVAQRDELIECT